MLDISHQRNMHLSFRAGWSLVASLACLGAIVDAAGVLEVDLVFPRNETYAPTAYVPIIFALRNGNADLGQNLRPSINYNLRNITDPINWTVPAHISHELASANSSSYEPYFVHNFFSSFATEGRWELFWWVTWLSCDEDKDDLEPSFMTNSENRVIEFTIKNDGQVVDIVAATANDKTCPAELGLAINVTDTTMEISRRWNRPAGTCAVLASSPTPTPDPCLVKISSAVVASMSASWTARICNIMLSLDPPDNCPKDNAGPQRLAVAGVACLAVAFGAFGFLLA